MKQLGLGPGTRDDAESDTLFVEVRTDKFHGSKFLLWRGWGLMTNGLPRFQGPPHAVRPLLT